MTEYVTVPASKLQETAYAIYEDGKHRLVSMFANDERGLNGNYAIYCAFAVGKSMIYLA
jgi:Ni,Fe-hydrogenase III component G